MGRVRVTNTQTYIHTHFAFYDNSVIRTKAVKKLRQLISQYNLGNGLIIFHFIQRICYKLRSDNVIPVEPIYIALMFYYRNINRIIYPSFYLSVYNIELLVLHFSVCKWKQLITAIAHKPTFKRKDLEILV